MLTVALQKEQLQDSAMLQPRLKRKASHQSQALARALEKAQIAVRRDEDGNLRGALSSYRSAKDLLSKAKNRLGREEDALKLDAIARTYENRIRELRQAIHDEPQEDSDDFAEEDESIKTLTSRPVSTSSSYSQVQTSRKALDDRRSVQSTCSSGRDSHQQWSSAVDPDTKAISEKYARLRLPDIPQSRTPRLSQRFDNFATDDETTQVLDLFASGWWEDLIEGGCRRSLSSETTLVASPRTSLEELYEKSVELKSEESRAESPTEHAVAQSATATNL